MRITRNGRRHGSDNGILIILSEEEALLLASQPGPWIPFIGWAIHLTKEKIKKLLLGNVIIERKPIHNVGPPGPIRIKVA